MTWLALLHGLMLLVHVLSAFLLLLYGLNCYVMLFLHRRARGRLLQHDTAIWKAWHASRQQLPRVSVQLPLYNERYVVERLVEAVVHLHYPKERLEIQILDDSTDETTALALALVEHYCRQGVNIDLLHRQERSGYKAGALKAGLAVATGEFIAIFDADFVPHPDFLMHTLPFFQDPAVAMVQTRWGHINREYSVLTRAQAFGIDGHFWVEQTARCWSGLFMNFNGSGGIWRRQAIDAAGGWQADTLTEDLDLSYRAQLQGWRLKFLPQVVCPAELPVQMSAIKSQQHRWAKGSMQTAKKLLPRIWRAQIPLWTKYQAVFHLTSYLVHPCMLMVILTSPLLIRFETFSAIKEHFLVAMALALPPFGPSILYLYAHSQLSQDRTRRLGDFLYLLIFGTGIALNNTKAILEALCNVRSAFVRTPKFRIETPSDTWGDKRYHLPVPWVSAGEALLALYGVFGIVLALQRGTYLIHPFLLLYTIGFAAVALVSVWESVSKRAHRRRQSPEDKRRRGRPSRPEEATRCATLPASPEAKWHLRGNRNDLDLWNG
jgi:cellulose synthase/poly-beta-1,6-N-acetylglucosamine synthase-like glycosyltransferase